MEVTEPDRGIGITRRELVRRRLAGSFLTWESSLRQPGRVGLITSYGGGRAGIHFAGEHAATDSQGFSEGAVESGERCAREIARSGS